MDAFEGTDSESEDSEPADQSEDEQESATEEVDQGTLEDAVMEAMRDFDEGDGAPRDEVIDQVLDAYNTDQSAVEDAIESALMEGRCYEPADGTLKSI